MGSLRGVAEFLEVDPMVVRLIFVALALLGGPGILIYIIMLLVVPREPGKVVTVDREEKTREFVEEVGRKTKKLIDETKDKL